MAKKSKKKEESNLLDSFKEGMSILADVGLNVMIGNIKNAASDAFEEAQKKGEEVLHATLKAVAVFCIMIFGLILAVVGLGGYMDTNVRWLGDGLGYIFVGGCLIAFGLVIQYFRK